MSDILKANHLLNANHSLQKDTRCTYKVEEFIHFSNYSWEIFPWPLCMKRPRTISLRMGKASTSSLSKIVRTKNSLWTWGACVLSCDPLVCPTRLGKHSASDCTRWKQIKRRQIYHVVGWEFRSDERTQERERTSNRRHKLYLHTLMKRRSVLY